MPLPRFFPVLPLSKRTAISNYFFVGHPIVHYSFYQPNKKKKIQLFCDFKKKMDTFVRNAAKNGFPVTELQSVCTSTKTSLTKQIKKRRHWDIRFRNSISIWKNTRLWPWRNICNLCQT